MLPSFRQQSLEDLLFVNGKVLKACEEPSYGSAEGTTPINFDYLDLHSGIERKVRLEKRIEERAWGENGDFSVDSPRETDDAWNVLVGKGRNRKTLLPDVNFWLDEVRR